VLHVNSTRQGGGVAEILSSLTPLMNDVGIETEWLVIVKWKDPQGVIDAFCAAAERGPRHARPGGKHGGR
jgi:trehalose synthase